MSAPGWRRIRLRFVAEVGPTTPVQYLDPEQDVTFLPLEAIWPDARYDASRLRPAHEVLDGYTRFVEGDVLVPKITPTFEAARSAVARRLRGGMGFGTTELHVLRPGPDLDPRFLWYRTLAYDFIADGTSAMVGVAGQKRVPGEFVKDFEFDLPSVDDQRRIADFLDAETERLGRLVGTKNRLPRLLDEKLAATFERLIWDGRHRLWPLKYLVNSARPIMYGIVLPGPSVENGVPLVKGGDVERGSLEPGRLARVAPETEAPYARSRLWDGDLLVSIRGSFGAVAEVTSELTGANITQDSARVSPGSDIDGRYLLYALRSPTVRRQLSAVVTGATIRGVNIRDLKRVKVPVPVASRQREIAGELDDLTQQLRRVRSTLARQLGVIRQRHDALITAAVTGELDPTSSRASALTT